MSTLTLKQLTDRQTIALTERSDIGKIASLFDSTPRPYYFAKQSDMQSKLSNIPYIMAMTYKDGRIFVELNIIRDLYDKQTILNAKYNVRIDKNMYDYINCYIYKYYKIHEVLEKEHFTYLDISIYVKITHILTRNKQNQFPSDIAIIYFIDDNGIQVFDTPTKDEVIESIRQVIENR